MKKGANRRYEEARQLKRSSHDDIESLMDRIDDDPFDSPRHARGRNGFRRRRRLRRLNTASRA